MPLSLQEIIDARNWMNQQWAGSRPWQWNGDYRWGANEQADRTLMGMAQAHGYNYNDIASLLNYGNMGPTDTNPIQQSWNQFVGSRTGNDATNQYAIDRGFIDRVPTGPTWGSQSYYSRDLDQRGFNSPFVFSDKTIDGTENGPALTPAQKLAFLRERLTTANRPGMQNRIQSQINRLSGIQPNHTRDVNQPMTAQPLLRNNNTDRQITPTLNSTLNMVNRNTTTNTNGMTNPFGVNNGIKGYSSQPGGRNFGRI